MCVLIAITLAFLGGQPADSPKIVENLGRYSLQLPSQIQTVLHLHDSTFVCWRFEDYDKFIQQGYQPNRHQLPYAIIGDFNGDGVLDVVLDGHNATNRLLLVVQSSNESYSTVELSRSDYITPANEPIWSSLTFVAKGTTIEPVDGQPVQLKTDAFEWGSEKGSHITYFQDCQFIDIVTGD